MPLDDLEISSPCFYTKHEAMWMDLKFCDAMKKAKKRGLESFEEGVKVDLTPMVPTHFSFEAKFCGCSSAAALCADETNAAPWLTRSHR